MTVYELYHTTFHRKDEYFVLDMCTLLIDTVPTFSAVLGLCPLPSCFTLSGMPWLPVQRTSSPSQVVWSFTLSVTLVSPSSRVSSLHFLPSTRAHYRSPCCRHHLDPMARLRPRARLPPLRPQRVHRWIHHRRYQRSFLERLAMGIRNVLYPRSSPYRSFPHYPFRR